MDDLKRKIMNNRSEIVTQIRKLQDQLACVEVKRERILLHNLTDVEVIEIVAGLEAQIIQREKWLVKYRKKKNI